MEFGGTEGAFRARGGADRQESGKEAAVFGKVPAEKRQRTEGNRQLFECLEGVVPWLGFPVFAGFFRIQSRFPSLEAGGAEFREISHFFLRAQPRVRLGMRTHEGIHRRGAEGARAGAESVENSPGIAK